MGVFFAIAGAIIIAIGFLVHLRAQAKGRKAQLWPTTKGAVLTSDVAVVQMMGNPMSTPAVTYSYEVGGQALQGAGLRVGAPRLFNKPDKAAALAAQYPVGSQVTVHYDPANSNKHRLGPGRRRGLRAADDLFVRRHAVGARHLFGRHGPLIFKTIRPLGQAFLGG